MNILLVEDSPTIRAAMEHYIRAADHHCLIAENGETAVQMVETEQVDLIIMDVEMPGLNGFETTRLIREQLGDHWIPVIFVTGLSEEKNFKAGIDAGGDDYLIKPVSPVILKAKIQAMERLVNMRDQLREANDQLRLLSQRDALTGLYNRRFFDDKADELWRHAARHKRQLSVLLLDIDHFKRYNDRYGHLAGDECIKAVAKCVSDTAHRSDDVAARFGGEEFIILLPETGFDGAEHLAERLRESVEKLDLPHAGSKVGRVTVSVGGASLRYTTGWHMSKLIDYADKALYESKSNGRNCAHVSEINSPHQLLMIESETSMADEFAIMLDGHCEVHTLNKTQELNTAVKAKRPELVILAIENELDESIGLYKQFLELSKESQKPLVLLSDLNKDRLKRIARTLGAKGSIQMPMSQHQLISRIDHFLLSPE
ncbi:GGDEF domain-containing response regulator [Agaribacterium haliotis]|uniref:GGDEF domain-containing response regulator n=1 Tax=Agaribacterium haliotis TaxID=2013869 RepID=UPI0013047330|nr:diguanylate cyclase [Agaribacterium haliotis]